jgi:asparagine synthase (glutamine-hydrolysing)
MCGIAGIYHSSGAPSGDWRTVLEQMTRTLVHRGPDDEGYFLDDFVGLGHRRLSIVDVASGHQPMSNEDGSVRLVCNGEIYNFQELRHRLEAKGHRFRTRSDTETVVHAYEEWDTRCLEELRGMFAFALWDTRRRRLFLARDRLGKKPLYYARVGDALVFGSEIKALTAFPGLDRTLDLEAVSDYLSLLYIPREKSIFRNVRKLLPGHCLMADGRQPTVRRYWDLDFTPVAHVDAPAAAQRLAELLREAVTLRLQSDVPLGAFLSGGIDSSAVVGLMAQAAAAPVITASIGFPDHAYDELPYARMVARHFGTDHRESVVTPHALDVLEDLTWYYDEPFGDSSAIPTYWVSKLARERVTVALSGDGGDESFAGYRRYYFDGRENRVRALLPARLGPPLFRLIGALYPKGDCLPQVFRGKAFLSNVARTPWEAYLHSVSGISETDKLRLLNPDVTRTLAGYRTADLFADLYRAAPATDALSRIQYIDFKTYLPDDILVKVDRASMANSLEVRCPLLDHTVVEYAASLPSHMKLKGSHAKLILKEAVRDFVPADILRRRKMGFAMPVATWLRHELRPMVEQDILHFEHGMFDAATIRRMWRQHVSGRRQRTTELWGVLIFNLWHKRFGGAATSHSR